MQPTRASAYFQHRCHRCLLSLIQQNPVRPYHLALAPTADAFLPGYGFDFLVDPFIFPAYLCSSSVARSICCGSRGDHCCPRNNHCSIVSAKLPSIGYMQATDFFCKHGKSDLHHCPLLPGLLVSSQSLLRWSLCSALSSWAGLS